MKKCPECGCEHGCLCDYDVPSAKPPVAGSATLLACPTCGTQPETRGWQTYCPTCLLEAPPGEIPSECEANWNKMIAGQDNDEFRRTDPPLKP